jgi:hypothetical protein
LPGVDHAKMPPLHPGAGHPQSLNQPHAANAAAHQKIHHMRAAIMHLRAAGANDIADRIEHGLKARMEKQGDQAAAECQDCKKAGKTCSKCKGAKKDASAKACPDCKKDGKACPKCEGAKKDASAKACPDCKKDGKACPKCEGAKKDAGAKACPDCKKDGKACPKCEGTKKSEAQSFDPAKLREHLQARDARVEKAIGELRKQVTELRRQLDTLRARSGATSGNGHPGGAKKKAPATPEQKKEPKKSKSEKKASSNVSVIEV